MTLCSSPHPKESAALSLGQAQQVSEPGKIKELVDPGSVVMPSSATSFASDGSEDAGFEDGPIDVDMGDEETDGIQIDCIQTLTEFEPLPDGTSGSLMSDFKTAIPLPAPPMVGSAYGGNQAYVNIQNALPRIMDRPNSPLQYWQAQASASETNVLPSRMTGDVGLNNIGNTCFMNSALQCLLHTSPLVEFFVGRDRFERTDTSLVYQFHSLVTHAWFGYAGAIYLHDFKTVLGNKYSQFKDCRQHDCQEFLAVLLDLLHEELKSRQKAALPAADSSVSESCADARGSSPVAAPADQTETKTTVTEATTQPCPSPTSSQPTVEDKNNSAEASSNNNWDYEDDSKPVEVPLHKRLKLETEKESEGVETISRASADLDTCDVEVKRKAAGSKQGSQVQLSVPDITSNEEDEHVDVENIENEAEGNCQDDDELPQNSVSPVQKAHDYWDNYMKENNTVIASTFQGMFKSSVTCSECSFISETYEPFMYLSLPIPRVMEKQIKVTFISMKDRSQRKLDLTLHLMETVEKLIQQVLVEVDGCFYDDQVKCVAAEVFNHRVFRILDEQMQLRNISTNTKNIYVYELNDNFNAKYEACNGITSEPTSTQSKPAYIYDPSSASTSSFKGYNKTLIEEENWETDDICTQPVSNAPDSTPSTSTFEPLRAPVGGGVYDATATSSAAQSTSTFNDDSLLQMYNENFNRVQCNICLEEYPRGELKQHKGCSCVLCEECLAKSVEHFQTEGGKAQEGSYVKCAVCLQTVECKRAFVSLEELTSSTSPPEFINISVIFRNEPCTDANNNSSAWNPGLFGCPWVIRVPSYLNAADLVDYIEEINPAPQANHRILSVKSDGKNCGQCVFSSRCSGCEIPREGMISLNTCNSILISYSDLSEQRMHEMQPPDMIVQSELSAAWQYGNRNDEPTIDIHDCLRTFSETEHLDEQNPWFCPKCKKNQRATKALSICKFPDYLIVYLKRFVFLDQSSNKLNNRLTFPINDLDVSDYVTEGFGTDVGKYNLYSCVCHFGSVSVGHYTAFAKNPVTNQWHYFNDDSVTERAPADNEHASAYVLFYEKQGMQCNIPAKCNRPLPELNSFNTTTTTTTTFTADTRGNYLPSESTTTDIVRTDDYMNEVNRQVDSTSVNYNYPQPSTEMNLEVDEGVGNETSQLGGEVRDGLGFVENDNNGFVTSSTVTVDDDLMKDTDLDFDNVESVSARMLEDVGITCASTVAPATSTSSSSTPQNEPSSSSNGYSGSADSTSN